MRSHAFKMSDNEISIESETIYNSDNNSSYVKNSSHPIYKYYSKIDNNKWKCINCPKHNQIIASSGNTTNLVSHLKRKYSSIFLEYESLY